MLPTPTVKPYVRESRAHLFALGALIIGLAGVALLEATDNPRDPLPGWYLLIWPFIAISGDVGYVVSGDPESEGFVGRGVLYVFGLHLLLAAVQAGTYGLPDPAYTEWLRGRPVGDHPYVVQPWLVAVAHLVGLVFAPVITFMLRTIRRLWAVGPEAVDDR